ncbi:cytosine permease [Paraburkholderia sp. BL25I1N1]|uniref:purine-cytosine permease family protein n=1 Tax=Paraburkholderia sp. BL25I1N1 TaxID=1938804 RepID=UPI000D4FD4A6|nr:cytosine permease [Paraburkholderia sp. BL25I1N1]PRX92041.1 NCS1 family nucleobase:cation symporter-1 [Paraburkholderia sp. BL25I1N1]
MSQSDFVEARSFEHIPERERHGNVTAQFQLWFMINATLITLFTGAVGTLYKLDLGWTLVAIVAGSIFGTLFQAFHGAQGPRMGLPQMIQSRVQFGSRGAVLPLAAAMLCQFGFAVFFIQTGAQSIADVTRLAYPHALQIAFGITAMAVAIIGYRLVLQVERFASCATLINLVLLTVAAFTLLPLRSMLSQHHFTMVPFLAQFGASATYQIAIAPIVSDYTRYLPSRTKGSAVSCAVFFGTMVSAVWLESLGAALSIAFPSTDLIASIRDLGDRFGYGLGSGTMIVSAFSCLIACAVTIYSGTVAVLSAAEAFRPIRSTVSLRAATIACGGVLAIIAVISMPQNILDSFSAFLSLLGYFLIPWTAINLTDYYFVRRGAFSITDIMDPNGGIYRKWNSAGIISYACGFTAMIPFFSTSLYTGPIAMLLDRADIAFSVGLFAATAVYLFLMRRFDRAGELDIVARAPLNTLDAHVRTAGGARAAAYVSAADI